MDIHSHIDISPSAAKRIAALLAQEIQPGSVFRVAVDGGGCSGFQYRFAIDISTQPEDKVFRKDDAVIAVDETSLNLLAGSQLDYVETLAGAAFEIKNPNSTSRCGCGNSFSIA
jgi:iron-sulfur cluster insertion protein